MRFFSLLFVLSVILLPLIVSLSAKLIPSPTQSIAYQTQHWNPPQTPRTLILYSTPSSLADFQSSHSKYLAFLKDSLHHSLSFANPSEDSTRLAHFDTFHYDNVLIFSSDFEDFGDGIPFDALRNFHDAGRNILVVGSNLKVNEMLRDILDENNVEVEEDEFHIVDQQNSDIVASDEFSPTLSVWGPKGFPKGKFYFRGLPHSLIDTQTTRMTIPLIYAENTHSVKQSGNSNGDSSSPSLSVGGGVGGSLLLVSAIQSENNGRLAFVGSAESFGNQFFEKAESNNLEVLTALTQWVTGGRGLLRAHGFSHHKKGSDVKNPPSYRVSDDITVDVTIEEYNGQTREWMPFTQSDVQLEFTMIDPYLRDTLKTDGKGHFTLSFVVPDVYGVYKFIVDYWRKGYSHMLLSHQLSVHPYRHDEYERFILAAFPYYSSAFAVMGAFVLFTFLFFYSSEK